MNRTAMFAAVLGVSAALPLAAQGRGQDASRTQSLPKAETRGGGAVQSRPQVSTGVDARGRATSRARGPSAVPPGHWPRAGMCRVWIDGVAPGQQPKEMDCATARRRVPANGRVLDGNNRPQADRDGWYDRDDDGRYDRDDDDRNVRRFIDRNGLECEERAVMKDGRRSYDLKCREPKRNDRDNAGWPPARGTEGERYCIDANRDGRCDSGVGRGYPTTLPDMLGALVYADGQRTNDVAQWLGTGHYQVRYIDQNRDRKPERVRWLDGAGTVLQEWMDNNRDGRADIVNVYSGGRIVQSIGGR